MNVRTLKLAGPGTAPECGVKCKTAALLDYHISAIHVENGNLKHQSEQQMAAMFKREGILFDHDRQNTLTFATCTTMSPLPSENSNKPRSLRVDFYLTDISVKLGIRIFVGNDEFSHQRYRCDSHRTLNFATMLSTNPDKTMNEVPIVYIRVNPHHYYVNETLFAPKMDEVHKRLLKVLTKIEDGDYEIKNYLNLIYVWI
jgi:hypothetical protein